MTIKRYHIPEVLALGINLKVSQVFLFAEEHDGPQLWSLSAAPLASLSTPENGLRVERLDIIFR